MIVLSAVDLVVGLAILAVLGWALSRVIAYVSAAVRRGRLSSNDGRAARRGRPPWVRSSMKDVEETLEEHAGSLQQRLGTHADSREQCLEDPAFATAAGWLRDRVLSVADVIALTGHENPWVSRVALAVLSERDVPASWTSRVVRALNSNPDWDAKGLLVASLARADGEVIGPVLSKVDCVLDEDLVWLLQARTENRREEFSLTAMRKNVARSLSGDIAGLLMEHGEQLPAPFARRSRSGSPRWTLTAPTSDGKSQRNRDRRAQQRRPLPYLRDPRRCRRARGALRVRCGVPCQPATIPNSSGLWTRCTRRTSRRARQRAT